MSNQDNQKIEIRSFSLDGAKAEEGKISGRAIAFGEASRDLGGWVEVIDRDAVTLDDDLYIDFSHDPARILGRRSNGTLSVDVRKDGVSFEAVPPETSWAADVMAMMRGGYVSGCSFAMRVFDDEWSTKDGVAVRHVKDCHVYSLTVTGIPAYPTTTAEARDAMAALAGDHPENMGEAAEAAEQQGCGGEDPGSDAEARYMASRLGAIRIVESEN